MRRGWKVFAGVFVCLAVLVTFSTDSFAKKRYVFGGGPSGGTFQVVANAIQTFDPIKDSDMYRIQAQSSGGSVENLRTVNSGRVSFGTVYAGHLFLGRNGKMKNDPNKYTDVLAVSYLYGAPAQLVVRKGSGIEKPQDLVGKKVGVGNAGSGAFANAELFFTHMGIWDKMERNAMGYNDAAQAFGNEQLDAFWLFTAYPSGAVIQAATTNNIDLVDLYGPAEEAEYFKEYPYFSKLVIPGGVYRGVTEDTPSFQDSTLLVANKDVPEDVIYDLLSKVYSEEGLKWMVSQKKTFREMSVESGVNGINPEIIPLHPGAEKFWREKGVLN
ncbi:MAG: TAXI family TRAP transporter solute-binding subunit [Desulfovibrionales bacterium]